MWGFFLHSHANSQLQRGWYEVSQAGGHQQRLNPYCLSHGLPLPADTISFSRLNHATSESMNPDRLCRAKHMSSHPSSPIFWNISIPLSDCGNSENAFSNLYSNFFISTSIPSPFVDKRCNHDHLTLVSLHTTDPSGRRPIRILVSYPLSIPFRVLLCTSGLPIHTVIPFFGTLLLQIIPTTNPDVKMQNGIRMVLNWS